MAVLCLAACNSGAPAVQLNSGQPAPTFQTFAADGTPVHFPAAFVGKPLVIRFWADWCKYCEGEMKAIETVYQRHRGPGCRCWQSMPGRTSRRWSRS